MISARHTIKNYRRIPAEHLVRTARLDEHARLVKEYPSVRTIQRRVVDDATARIGHRRDVGLNNLPCLVVVPHWTALLLAGSACVTLQVRQVLESSTLEARWRPCCVQPSLLNPVEVSVASC